MNTTTQSLKLQLQLFLFACLLAFALPIHAATEDKAALVLFSHGNVVLTNHAGSYPLEKGNELDAGDTVITGNDGRVQLRFTDGGLVSLMPNSRFAVEEYSQPSANSEGSVSVNLLKGGLRALSGSIGKKDQDSYKLKTDVATLGIRGTQFVVVMDGDAMRVHVGQGSVALFNDFGELLVPMGQHAEVFPGQAPVISNTAPVFVSARQPNTQSEEEQAEANQDPAAANTSSEVVRALEPGVTQGAKAGEFFVEGENGEQIVQDIPKAKPKPKPDPEPTDPSTPETYEDGFAFAYVVFDSTAITSDLMSVSYGPKFAALMEGGPVDTQFKELNELHKVGDLYWGEVKGSDYDQAQMEQSIHLTQIWGSAASELPLEGTLSYKLNGNGALPMHTSWEGEELTQFDLDIYLHGNNRAKFLVNMATSSMGFTGVANDEVFITSPQSGGVEDYGIGGFNFTAEPAGQEGCTSCSLDVSGFLSGKGGTQAGVVYDLTTPDGNLAGGAILDKR